MSNALGEFAEATGRWILQAGADRDHGLAEVAVVVRGEDGLVATAFVTNVGVPDDQARRALAGLLATGLMMARTEGGGDAPL